MWLYLFLFLFFQITLASIDSSLFETVVESTKSLKIKCLFTKWSWTPAMFFFKRKNYSKQNRALVVHCCESVCFNGQFDGWQAAQKRHPASTVNLANGTRDFYFNGPWSMQKIKTHSKASSLRSRRNPVAKFVALNQQTTNSPNLDHRKCLSKHCFICVHKNRNGLPFNKEKKLRCMSK